MLVVATPVRGAELSTAIVTLGYCEFRVRLALDGCADAYLTFCLDVVRARNRIVAMVFENTSVDHVLWVDDDNYPTRGPVVVREMVEIAERTGAGIVAAPYTNKQRPLRWTHRVDGRDVLGVGFGFTLTTTAALRAMAEDAAWYMDLPRGRTPNLFGQRYDKIGGEITLLSEDYSFCLRAREHGIKIVLHEDAGVIHHAGGHAWGPGDAREAHQQIR